MNRILVPSPHTPSPNRARAHWRWRVPSVTTWHSFGRGMGPSGAFAFRVCRRCRGVVNTSALRCPYCHPPARWATFAVWRALPGRIADGVMIPLARITGFVAGLWSRPEDLEPSAAAPPELDLDAAIAVVRSVPRPRV